MGRHVIAYVSKSALRHNLEQIRSIAPKSKIIAMVKANAYGHGLKMVAKTIEDADALGVASIEEALQLRDAGIQTDIILMEGIFRSEELSLVHEHRLTLVVHHWQQIQALQNFTELRKKFRVWVKVNTGMNRLGFSPHEFVDAWSSLSLPNVDLIGSMTHFAQADEKNNDLTKRQCELFYHVVGSYPGQRCLANSAGILNWPFTHADWVRPGLILYGASPLPDVWAHELNLKPVMTLRSEIIATRNLEVGEKVGYGGTWENTKKLSKIGIVAIGYGDGYPWHAKNGTPVLVNGQRTFLTGRVSMDMLAVDISHIGHVTVGDPVTLWGDGLPIEEVARHAGTIPYELFCRFSERVTVKSVN